jgi:hypothetical protein
MSESETSKNNNNDKLGELFKDEYAVILLQGKNSFGDMIYSYVKVNLPNIKLLYAALNSGKDFTPSDFGSIVAAGKGVPSDGLRSEMSSSQNMFQSIPPAVFKPNPSKLTPAEKKEWNEF